MNLTIADVHRLYPKEVIDIFTKYIYHAGTYMQGWGYQKAVLDAINEAYTSKKGPITIGADEDINDVLTQIMK